MSSADPFQSELQQAQKLRSAGQLQGAASLYQQILAHQADHYEANYSLGMLLHEVHRSELAVPLLARAAEIRPDVFAGWINLGLVQRSAGLNSDSVTSLRQACKLEPKSALAHSALALSLLDSGNDPEALEQIKHCLEIDHSNAVNWSRRGMVHQVRGEIEEADDAFKQAIRLQPDWLEPRRSRVLLQKQSEASDNLNWLEKAWNSTTLGAEQRILVAFTLGKAHDDLGQYSRAFEWLQRGHELQLAESAESPQQHLELFDRHREHLGQALLDHCREHAVDDETAFFVMGMPRSGTSLCEQILASHPQVHGAGEIEHLRLFAEQVRQQTGKTFPEGVLQLPPEVLARTATAYLQRLRQNANDARHVVDKVPNNFFRIGLIAAILPKARIIVCEREARDNCLSVYQNVFGPGHAWASDLPTLGRYYLAHQQLMAFWESLLPDRLFRVRYEDMVTDTEAQVRGVLDYCGLEFDPNCLQFHRTRRQVRTPSEAQVRQPIYHSSMQRWKRYEQQLQPLLQVLQTG